MISLQSKRTIESQSVPGVTFTVRTLNKIQRAKRDLGIIGARVKCSALASEYAPLAKLVEYKDVDGGVEIARDDRTPEQAMRCTAIDAEYTWIENSEVKPAVIRAGLVSIDGLEIDGKTADAEGLLDSGVDELIEEIFKACDAASGLNPTETKNLQSDTTSTGSVVSE